MVLCVPYVQDTNRKFLLLWWEFTLLQPPFLQGTVVFFLPHVGSTK